jgi:hypothetical protein
LAANLAAGELAINTADGKLFYKDSSGTVQTIASKAGSNLTVGTTSVTGGTNGYILYNNSGTLGNINTTGSGNVVLSTSPTLVTPVLGTPTSGTLTNCTGYTTANLSGSINLATQVTGTLPIANGGTSITTYTTGDILYASATNTLSKLAAGTNGNVLTLAGGVPSWAAAGGSSTLAITDFTATSGQTTFSVSYTVGLVEGVYRNGIKLGTADYTASNGTTIVLNTGATTGDLIQVVAFSAVSLANVVSTISFGSTGLTPSTATNGAVTVSGTLAVANGGTGASSLTANNVLLGNGTSAVQAVAPSTTGNVLTSNGTTWTSAPAGGGFPAGTRMSFQQTSAPTGWTKDTTAAINDAILRLVTGSVSSGGSTAFSTFNGQTSVGATTLSTSQIPSHNHSNGLGGGQIQEACSTQNYGPGDTGFTGGGGSHTHSITTNIKYYDFIIASKD